MYSPRSKDRDPSDYSSFPLSRKPSQQSNFFRRQATDIVDERVKSYTQLQTFYMPYLKKAFQDHKLTNPSLRSPQELIFSSRLLQMRQSQSKRRIDFLQVQNERKDKRIHQMNEKMVEFVERLRMYEPNLVVDSDGIGNTMQESEKKIKKLESLLKIRNQETFFRLKLKAMSLLQEFDMSKQDTQPINQIDSQHAVFQYIINKLRTKIKDIKQRSRLTQQQSQKGKRSTDSLHHQLLKLSQTNELLRTNERKLKQRQQDIKKQWTTSIEKLIQREKEVELMDVEIFRLKRLLEEKDGMLLKSNSQTFTKTARADDLKREYEVQVKDQRQIITALTIDVGELKQQLEFVSGELEEGRIREKFKGEEQEKTYREYIRWKERCEWYEKEREGKVSYYEERNKVLEVEVEKLKNEVAEVQSVDVMNSSQMGEMRSGYDHLHVELQYKNEEIRFLEDKCRRLEEESRVREYEKGESSKYLMEDYGRRKDEEWERRLREKEGEMKRRMEDLKEVYEERLMVKDRKHMEQLEVVQGELRRHEEQGYNSQGHGHGQGQVYGQGGQTQVMMHPVPLIQKKSDYLASRANMELKSSNSLQYERI